MWDNNGKIEIRWNALVTFHSSERGFNHLNNNSMGFTFLDEWNKISPCAHGGVKAYFLSTP